MTSTATRGGARPKVREDDQRGKHGTPRPTAGRKPQAIRFKLGDRLLINRNDKEGNAIVDDYDFPLWTVEAIDRVSVTLRCDNGDKIRLRR